jgi:hypothetical protein
VQSDEVGPSQVKQLESHGSQVFVAVFPYPDGQSITQFDPFKNLPVLQLSHCADPPPKQVAHTPIQGSHKLSVEFAKSPGGQSTTHSVPVKK